jgi:phage shock protein PspC (stress-responsive transcriptional regulator)
MSGAPGRTVGVRADVDGVPGAPAGVLGGVARWSGLPVARVRLVVAALAVLTFGVAGVLYLAAWLLAPAGGRRRRSRWSG